MENTCGFRLQEINHNTDICSSKDLCDDTATSVSSYSNTFKQRIDAMFDDSRSVLSEMSRNDKKTTSFSSKDETYKERVITNNIQEKIEKMFKEISLNGNQKTNASLKCPSSTPVPDPVVSRDFKVNYLGSKPLPDKNVSLTSLQTPLKELYFERSETESKDNIDTLRISRQGLNLKGPGKEELHPFSTIAVWAAVKLAFRGISNTTEYAFLPLIKDPDGIDKNLLFKELKQDNKRELPQHVFKKFENHSPIFTVVMKNINANKQLECHGFICESSEDAIVIAANLYQALMKKLKRRKDHKEEKTTESQNTDNSSINIEKPRLKPNVKLKKPAPPVPARPPRKPKPPPEMKNESLNSQKTFQSQENHEEDVIKSSDDTEKSDKDEALGGGGFQRRGSVPVNLFNVDIEPGRTLRRTVSDRGSHGITVKDKCDAGDILTKVAIPRSQSFLNANGPLTRFSRRHQTNTQNEIISPLGFKELFNEFKLQEGLENMDDILNAIIDAEGMSFNDLKPIYKEFLLKLAMTLTKDEMYQRSKIIMRRQKKRSRRCNFRKRPFITTMGLNKVFKNTACKLGKTKQSKPSNFEFTSVVFQPTHKQFESKTQKNKGKTYANRKRTNTRKRLIRRLGKARNCSMTSEESIFYLNKNTEGPNRSSSGYFSCSDCSYDSENCTCISADKCYCTLGHTKNYVTTSSDESGFVPTKTDFCNHKKKLELEDSVKSCSCDTESCPDSAKCYCNRKNVELSKVYTTNSSRMCQMSHLHQKNKLHDPNCPVYVKTTCERPKNSIFDQLKERGFISSESTLSRAASPGWHLDGSIRQTGYLRKPKIHNFNRLNVENRHLREIQNTTNDFEDFRFNFERNNRLTWRRGGSYCGRRQYSSMRCREEFLRDLTNSELLHRSASCRKQHLFSSVRSKRGCDSFMNQIKFPNSNNSSLRFTRRIDVYNIFAEQESMLNSPDNTFTPLSYKENWKKVVNECAMRADSQRMRCQANKAPRLNHEVRPSKTELLNSGEKKKKILVVSARDPRGKVVYMGASIRGEHAVRNSNGLDGSCANASEALAVKKSAEIAALFSDMSVKQKPTRSDSKKDTVENLEKRSKSYKSANLENGLGYLP